MQNAFQELIQQGFDVLGMFMSAKLFRNMQSAIQAREALELPQKKYMSWIATPLHGHGPARIGRRAALWKPAPVMPRLPCIGG